MSAILSPLLTSIVTMPCWLLLLEATAWVNSHHPVRRPVLLAALGAAIIAVLLVNVASLVFAVSGMRSDRSAKQLMGALLNGIQIAGIVALIAIGLVLNALT